MTSRTLRWIRLTAWVAVAVVAAAVAGMLALDRGEEPTALTTATVGGPFELVDHDGERVTEAALRGHPSALFFGFTFCPDVCPTTLADMTLWLEQLGTDADELAVFFVTVDPERDTPQQMAAYLEAFDPRIIGLTGSRAAVDDMLDAFRVYARRVPGEGDSYTMDHSASVYLFDSDMGFVGTADYHEGTETVLAKLRRLIDSS